MRSVACVQATHAQSCILCNLQTVCILQEIEWLKQFTAANVGQQTAIDSMQEAAQGMLCAIP